MINKTKRAIGKWNESHGLAKVLDVILISTFLVSMLGVIGFYQPLVVGPLDVQELNNSIVLFDLDLGERILIDKNLDFLSPDVYDLNEGEVIVLERGVYYWKVVGSVEEGDVKKLTVESSVRLGIKKSGSGDKFEVVNLDDKEFDVSVYNGEEIVSNFILGGNLE